MGERSGMFLEQSGAAGRRAERLIRGLAPGLRVHTGYPRPVHDHGLVVARPRRQGRAGEDKGHAPGTAILKGRAERDVDTHAGMSRVMLLRPSGALRQISPSPERTYQYSSMVRKWQARPTIPGGTVEWIMLPCGPSMRKRIRAPRGERPRSAVSTVVVFTWSLPSRGQVG
jgi:hypothetical protein